MKCLVPICENGQQTRGLCIGCFGLFRKYLKAGETTETEAIALGLLLPKRSPPGRPVGRSKFVAAIEKARKTKKERS